MSGELINSSTRSCVGQWGLWISFTLEHHLKHALDFYVSHSIQVQTQDTVYPKKYAHSFCFAVLCCGYTLTDFTISIRLTSLALWQSNDCPSASKATLMNMDKYFMWIHYERLHNHNKAKHNKTVCIFVGIYCTCVHENNDSNRCLVLSQTILIFDATTSNYGAKMAIYDDTQQRQKQ